MTDLDPLTDVGRAGLAAITTDPAHALIAFDYDGTLAPIVDDPAAARPQPGVVAALRLLATSVGQLAIITGRPAGEAVRLANLTAGTAPEALVVLGQYGVERWDAATGHLRPAEPSPGLTLVRRDIATVLERAGVPDAHIEDKGLALAVHVRRCPEPASAFARIVDPLTALAERAGLAAEPGRNVFEIRPAGMDKGKALQALMAEVGARSVMFTGDDLGDLAAFDAVDSWRSDGSPGLLVCSGSVEVVGLAERADLVVDGPPGVLDLLHSLTAAVVS